MAPRPKRARSEAEGAVAAPVRPLTAQDAKTIVADIKKELKTKKFYPDSHAVRRTVRFSAPRFPPNEAARVLGIGAGGKDARRTLNRDQIHSLLRLKPDTLKATLYRKPHRFAKPGTPDRRWGVAPLKLLSMEVIYKAGCLRGCMQCINETTAQKTGGVEVDTATDNAGALATVNAEADAGEQNRELPAAGDAVEKQNAITGHMRFDLLKPLSYFAQDDLSIMRMGVDGASGFFSCRRDGLHTSQRQMIERRMSLDLEGELALKCREDEQASAARSQV